MVNILSGGNIMTKVKKGKIYSPYGGDNKEWYLLPTEARYVERLPVVWDIMEAILERLENINRTNFPQYLKPGDDVTFEDIGLHGLIRQRLSKGTVERNLRYMRFMEKHDIPVNFRDPSLKNWLQHIDFREQHDFNNCVDGDGIGAIKHEWQAMRMVLTAYNVPIWNYKPPQPADTVNVFPMPEQVYEMINHRWSKNSYVNALVQYYLTFNFVVSWRPPSEPAYMKVKNVDFHRGLIKVIEPKKRLRERWLKVSEVLDKPNIKTFKNWIDKWRSKVENQHSGDYLFLYPDGRPFWNVKKHNGENLRMYVNRIIYPKILDIYPEYYNYCSRHFCGVSRLIRSYQQSKHFDIYAVSSWLGHKKLNTTLGYVQDAELYIEDFNFDWINRVLKAPYECEVNTVKNRQTQKNDFVEKKSFEKSVRRLPDSNR